FTAIVGVSEHHRPRPPSLVAGPILGSVVDNGYYGGGDRPMSTSDDFTNGSNSLKRGDDDSDQSPIPIPDPQFQLPSRIPSTDFSSARSSLTVSVASARRASGLSSPERRYCSIFWRAPSIVYFSVYSRCFTSMISSISRRWYTRLPERFLAGFRKRNWLSQ